MHNIRLYELLEKTCGEVLANEPMGKQLSSSSPLATDRRGNKLLFIARIIAWFILPLVIGALVAQAMGTVPSGGGFIIPVSPLVFAVLFCSVIMLYVLRPFFRNSRNLLVFTLFICGYTIIVYLIGIDTPNAVYYNTISMYFLLLPVYVVTAFPFLSPRKTIISFEGSRAKIQSIGFATSIMWLSPFFAEMLMLARWYVSGEFWHRISYMVLGGAGANDVLFYFGFWIFVSVCSFHISGRILVKGVVISKKRLDTWIDRKHN